MHKILSICQSCLLVILSLTTITFPLALHAEETPQASPPSYLITDIKSNQQGDAVSIEIIGNSQPVYTMYDLFNPSRLILDIAHATLGKNIDPTKIIPENAFVKIATKPMTDQDPSITRFEITIKDSHTYSVDRDKNNLLILVHPKTDAGKSPSKSTAQNDTPTGSDPATAQKSVQSSKDSPKPELTSKSGTDATLDTLIHSSESALRKATTQEKGKEQFKAKEGTFEDFGGYKNTKHISVDFFKIDLHNVFRLLREISGVNIIVDESVKGSLTLALNDVPWDFALDIILNLKDLRKEERFNTIVIYPADKAFVWPERAQDKLSVEADLNIVQQEQNALLVEQSTVLTDAQIQSKDIIQKARQEEKADNIEKAISLYEHAFQLDPKNAGVATRLANLNLSKLGANSKAVYFAKEALKIEPKNTQAALYAAIALANMQKNSEATEFFIQSISSATPMKEALISFASFNEQTGQNEAALKLLVRYNNLYGESVDTMVAKARIFDRMGQKNKADEQYQSLVASGYQLAPGLKEYIQSRLSGNRQ